MNASLLFGVNVFVFRLICCRWTVRNACQTLSGKAQCNSLPRSKPRTCCDARYIAEQLIGNQTFGSVNFWPFHKRRLEVLSKVRQSLRNFKFQMIFKLITGIFESAGSVFWLEIMLGISSIAQCTHAMYALLAYKSDWEWPLYYLIAISVST